MSPSNKAFRAPPYRWAEGVGGTVMQDMNLAAVDRTVNSVISVLGAAIKRAETMSNQQLADDLHEVLRALKRISGGIGSRGQAYKPK